MRKLEGGSGPSRCLSMGINRGLGVGVLERAGWSWSTRTNFSVYLRKITKCIAPVIKVLQIRAGHAYWITRAVANFPYIKMANPKQNPKFGRSMTICTSYQSSWMRGRRVVLKNGGGNLEETIFCPIEKPLIMRPSLFWGGLMIFWAS